MFLKYQQKVPFIKRTILVIFSTIFIISCGNDLYKDQTEIKVYPTNAEVNPGESLQIYVTGGVKPYRYRILDQNNNSDNKIDENGLFTASTQTGSAFIRVNDGMGAYRDTYITVKFHAGETPHAIVLYAIGLDTSETITISNNGSSQINLTETNPVNWFETLYYENDPYNLAITSSPPGKNCEMKGTTSGTMPNDNLIIPILCSTGFEIGGQLYEKDTRLLPPIDFRTMYTRNFSGSGGTAAYLDDPDVLNAQYDEPAGITMIHHSTGKALFIADRQNARIRMIYLSTPPYPVTTIAGSGTAQSNDGNGTAAEFISPNSLTTEGFQIYIVDQGANSIKKLELGGTNTVTTIAGPQNCGTTCASGDTDGVGNNARFNNPSKLVYARNFLYVTDTGNNKIKKINLLDNTVTTIGTGYTFNNPTGITADNAFLYIADTGNHRLVRISLDTETVDNIAGTGSAGTKDGPPGNSMVNAPIDLFYDGHFIYVTERDGNAIRKLNPSTGYLETLYISAGQGFNEGDIFTATFHNATATFDWSALASDGEQFYMADTHSHLIRTLSSDLVARYTLALNMADPLRAFDSSYQENHANINAASSFLGNSYNGKTNAAYEFDGTSSYIEQSAANLPSGSDPRTICAWVNIDDYKGDGTVQTIFSYDDFSLEVEYLSTNPTMMNLIASGASNSLYIPTGIWVHVCGVNDGANSKVYLNGKFHLSAATVLATNTAGNFQIGRDSAASNYFDGKIADVRVYKRALNQNEIVRLSVPIWDRLIAFYPIMRTPLNVNVVSDDFTSMQNNGTNLGDIDPAQFDEFNAFGDDTNAIVMDGNDNRINIPHNPQLSGLSSLTVSLWAKFSDITIGSNTDYIQTLVSKASNGGAANALTEWYLIYDTPNDALKFHLVDSSVNGSSLIWSGVKDYLHRDDWYHIAVTWNSGAMKMYVNGTEVATRTTGVPNDMQSLTHNLRIGGSGLFTAQGRPFNGVLDDVKIYHRALSKEEILAMARERGDNLVLRLGNSTGDDFSGLSTCSVTNIGNPPSIITNQNGTPNSAFRFDGVDETMYMHTGCNEKMLRSFANEEAFSICTWVSPENLPPNPGDFYALLDFKNLTSTEFTLGLYNDGTQKIGIYDNAMGLIIEKDFELPLNTWSHLCATYDGGDSGANNLLTLYLNGQNINQLNQNVLNTGYIIYIYLGSKSASNYFPGKLSDIRIYEKALTQEEIVRLGTQVSSGLVSHLAVVDNLSRTTDFINSTGTFTEEGSVTPLPTGPDRFGIANSAISLASASSQRLSHGDPTLGIFPEADEQRSLCAWAKGDSSSGQSFLNIAGYGSNNNLEGLILEIINDTTIYRPGIGRIGGYINTQHIFNENSWNHYCATYNGSEMVLYVNGVKHAAQAVTLNTVLSAFRIGSSLDGANDYWDGYIDDVKLYNRVLSDTEIQALSGYHPTQVSVWDTNPATSGLRFHIAADSLNLSDTDPIPSINDLSGNSNDLTAVSGGPQFMTNQINKLPAIYFDGLGYLQKIGGTIILPYIHSAFSVFNNNVGADEPLFCQIGDGSLNYGIFDPAPRKFRVSFWNTSAPTGFQPGMESTADASFNFSGGKYYLLSTTYNNLTGNGQLFESGINQLNTSVPYTPPIGLTNTFRLGADDGTNELNGYIAETIIYNTELNQIDREIVECYLSAKYALPLGHACP